MLIATLLALIFMTAVSIFQSSAYKTRTDTLGVNCFFVYFISCFICVIGLSVVIFRLISGV